MLPSRLAIDHLDWVAICDMCHTLAIRMKSDIPDLNECILVPVIRGGLIPCGILSYVLGIAVEGAVRVTSYDNSNEHGIARIDHAHHIPKPWNKVIFVDDIIDSGDTFRLLANLFPGTRFVAPTAKHRGLISEPKVIAAAQPVGIYADDVWVEFPWDSTAAKHSPLEGRD